MGGPELCREEVWQLQLCSVLYCLKQVLQQLLDTARVEEEKLTEATANLYTPHNVPKIRVQDFSDGAQPNQVNSTMRGCNTILSFLMAFGLQMIF